MPELPYIEVKKSVDTWLPIRLVDITDGYSNETGIGAGTGATGYYCAAGATSYNIYTIATADWRESGSGDYWLNIGASEFTTEGKHRLLVVATGSREFRAVLEVRDKTLAELVDDVGLLLAGVTVGTYGIGALAVATYAIGSLAFATGAIVGNAIATSAGTKIGGLAFDELAASHNIAGSFGEALATCRQVIAGGMDANPATNVIHYFQTDGVTVRITHTLASAATLITRTAG